MRTGKRVEEIIPKITTRYPINFPFTNTFIQIELEAHNELGYSQSSVLVIRGVTGQCTNNTTITTSLTTITTITTTTTTNVTITTVTITTITTITISTITTTIINTTNFTTTIITNSEV